MEDVKAVESLKELVAIWSMDDDVAVDDDAFEVDSRTTSRTRLSSAASTLSTASTTGISKKLPRRTFSLANFF